MDHGPGARRVVLLGFVLTTLSLPSAAQTYRSSVVGTDFDFIVDSDPSTFRCLESHGRRLREMPDKTRDSELVQPAFVFVAHYDDGTRVDVALDVDFGSEEAARAEAERYVTRLGKLPTVLRSGVDRLVVHLGEEDATAFSDIGLIVVYSDNATRRISTHDLEETLFHESVHAAWDDAHERSAGWRAAQESDGGFVTRYGRENPDREDLAESSLFAYTLLHHPERIPAPDADQIRRAIPARIAFVERLVPPGEPIFHAVGEPYACDGSASTFTVDGGDVDEGEASGGGESNICGIDRSTARGISDIVSNALMRGLDQEERRVRAYLTEAKNRYETRDELVAATAVEFGIDLAELEASVEEYYHVNCKHGDVDEVEEDEPELAAAPVEGPSPPDDTRPLLVVIAALLLGLLVVNTTTLAVLLKQARTAR